MDSHCSTQFVVVVVVVVVVVDDDDPDAVAVVVAAAVAVDDMGLGHVVDFGSGVQLSALVFLFLVFLLS